MSCTHGWEMRCLPRVILGKRPGGIERKLVFGWIKLMFANKWFCLSVCLCIYDTIYLQMHIYISNKRFLILITYIRGVRRPKYFTINYTRSLQGNMRICQGNFREFSGKKICARVWEPWSGHEMSHEEFEPYHKNRNITTRCTVHTIVS